MKKTIKSIILTVASLLFIVIAGITALIVLVNPNDFKKDICNIAHEKTGRTLEIKGNISWTLFPSMGLNIEHTTLSNNKNFSDSTFVEIGNIKANIRIKPLLSRKIQIDELIIKSPIINLTTNKNGISNWKDLGLIIGATKNQQSEQIGPHAESKTDHFQFRIHNFAVENATINYENKKTGEHYIAKELSFNSLPQGQMGGTLQIASLTLGKIQAKNVKFIIHANDNFITADEIEATLFGGNMHGKAKIENYTTKPKFFIYSYASNIDIKSLLQNIADTNKISGEATLKLNLSFQGGDKNSIINSLNGNGNFTFENGVLSGIDAPYQINLANSIINHKPKPSESIPPKTSFGSWKGTFTIKQGVLQNNDLLITSPRFSGKGSGEANLRNKTLNYILEARGVEKATDESGKQVEKPTDFSVPIKITGTFSNPKIHTDLTNLATKLLKGTTKEKAEKELKRGIKKYLNMEESDSTEIIKSLKLDKLFGN